MIDEDESPNIYIIGCITILATNMDYDFDTSFHSVYSLRYHLILVVKYRRKVFDNQEIIDELKTRAKNIVGNHGGNVINQETDKDHIHILFSAKPTTNLAKLVNALKTGTSKALRNRYPIEDKLWDNVLWSDSYCIISTGEVTLDQLKKYVESQGQSQEQET